MDTHKLPTRLILMPILIPLIPLGRLLDTSTRTIHLCNTHPCFHKGWLSYPALFCCSADKPWTFDL